MHFGRSEDAHGYGAAADSAADEQRARFTAVEFESTPGVLAIEQAARQQDGLPPGRGDLAAVCVSAERQVERSVTDGSQAFRRMHQDYPRTMHLIQCGRGVRPAKRRVVESAEIDIRERLCQR